MKTRPLALSGSIFFLLISAQAVIAQGPPLPASASLMVNQPPFTSDGFFAVNGDISAVIPLRIGRSYVCTLFPQDQASQAVLSSTVYWPNYPSSGVNGGVTHLTTAAQYNGSRWPSVPSTLDGVDVNQRRIAFTTDFTFPDVQVLNHFVVIVNSSTPGELVKLICDETSLFGGFNTNVNDFNFLEVENLSDGDVDIAVTGQGIAETLTQTLPSRSRVDLDIHSPAGVNAYGLLKVTHNGAKGAIQGRTSFYSGTIENFQFTGAQELKSPQY